MRDLLAPLLDSPSSSALLFDIDGTLAPIVPRARDASVPAPTRALLEALAGRYGLVACVSGRRATDARRLVGIESIAYLGNHGLELLEPGDAEAREPAGVEEQAARVERFARAAHADGLASLGVSLEDKRSIWSFHWREAPDPDAARQVLVRVAERAAAAGLVPHWGRKVLELRPPLEFDKGIGIASLLDGRVLDSALYAGDDSTDVDAFRKLRELREQRDLRNVVCVGVRSDEGPEALETTADLLVDGPEGVVAMLELLAA